MIAYFWRYSSCSELGRDIYKNGNNSNLLLIKYPHHSATADFVRPRFAHLNIKLLYIECYQCKYKDHLPKRKGQASIIAKLPSTKSYKGSSNRCSKPGYPSLPLPKLSFSSMLYPSSSLELVSRWLYFRATSSRWQFPTIRNVSKTKWTVQ